MFLGYEFYFELGEFVSNYSIGREMPWMRAVRCTFKNANP